MLLQASLFFPYGLYSPCEPAGCTKSLSVGKRLYFVGTNNFEAGKLGGRRLVSRLNGKGNVVFFTNPGQPNLDERLKGYQDILEDYKGIKIVEVFDIKADPGTALDQAMVYLTRTGPAKIDAFVSLESRSGANVAEAFRRGIRGDHDTVGYGSRHAQDAIAT